MTDDELELGILKRYVEQHKAAAIADPQTTDKCLRELDLRQVLQELTGQTGQELDYTTGIWFHRLAPARIGSRMGPLKPCANRMKNQDEHRFHARAWQGSDTTGPPDAWRRVRELEKVASPVGRTAESKQPEPHMVAKTTLRLFISHSSQDEQLAALLTELLKNGLHLRSNEIRCTSVEGYGLQGGADTDEQLRFEILETETLVGVLSATSLRSLYVLFELGARWGTGKHWIPLVSPGTSETSLGGPIGGKNALRVDSRADLLQLVTDLADQLRVTPDRPAAYSKYIDRILELRAEPQAKEAVTPADGVSRVIANAPTTLPATSLSSTYTQPAPALPRSSIELTLRAEGNGLALEAVSHRPEVIRQFRVFITDLRRRSSSGRFSEVPEFHGVGAFEQLLLEGNNKNNTLLFCESPDVRPFLEPTSHGGPVFSAVNSYDRMKLIAIPSEGIWQVTLAHDSSEGVYEVSLCFEWERGKPPLPWSPPAPPVTKAPRPITPVKTTGH